MIIKGSIKKLIKNIDKKTIFISVITSLMFLYYINPLENVELTEWNRTFCSAIMSGISINKRINNFYILFILEIPIVVGLCTFFYTLLFKYRSNYKNIFYKFCIILIFPIAASYITRYTNNYAINTNLLFETILHFFSVLAIFSIIDKDNKLSKKNIIMLFASYMIGAITLNIIIKTPSQLSFIIMSVIMLIYIFICLKTKIGKKYYLTAFNYIYLLTWIPTIIFVIIEILYTLNEKGVHITKYANIVYIIVSIFLFISFCIVFFTRKKEISFMALGCIGTIISLALTKYFYHVYQYVFDYGTYNNLYELGNVSVAADTILNGKLPIIDYFSAHALSDVWTKILY